MDLKFPEQVLKVPFEGSVPQIFVELEYMNIIS